ncbi:MAG TPA: DNA polymerase III subunit delta' [Gemmataceae bacterium]|nr:DNA polymerase III subunit delta' [Gemmataceae bacterium]
MAWQRIRGHDALVEGFRRAVGRGRLAHAYLFTGPAGVGKRLFALELAKSLLCEKSAEGSLQACDRCPSCVQVEAGTHPDFFTAARPPEALEFPIDLMRQLCQSFALKSARGRGKVVLIDDADDLNEEAANCFLKTLEEPPPRSVLILIGSTPDRQLQTIVSRCQVIRFAPLSPELVDELLQAQGVEDSTLRARLVRLSGGSPGMAKELADPALCEFRRNLLAGLTKTPIASVDLSRQWMDFVEEAGKESAAQRRRAQLVLRLIIDFLDDALTVAMNGTPRRTEADERAGLETLAQPARADRLLEALERCLEADRQIDRRVQLVLILEGLMDALGQKL